MSWLNKSFVGGFTVVLLFDQTSKFIAQSFNIISLNQGFSLNIAERLPVWFIVLIVFSVLCSWTYWLYKNEKISLLTLGLLWGAVGSNLIDRLLYGGVRDFLPLPLTDVKNNLADWVIGLILLYILYIELKPSSQKAKE